MKKLFITTIVSTLLVSGAVADTVNVTVPFKPTSSTHAFANLTTSYVKKHLNGMDYKITLTNGVMVDYYMITIAERSNFYDYYGS